MSDLTSDPTIVCKCHDITAGQVRDAVRNGACDLTLIQLRTGACRGIGAVTGRTVCGSCAPELVALMVATSRRVRTAVRDRRVAASA